MERVSSNVYNILIHDLDVVSKRHLNQLLAAKSEYRENLLVLPKTTGKPLVQISTETVASEPVTDSRSPDSGPLEPVQESSELVSSGIQSSVNLSSECFRDILSAPRRSTRIRKPIVRYSP